MIYKLVTRVIQHSCFPERPMKVGTSWVSRKEGNLKKGGIDLEKGGMTPLTNYGFLLFLYCYGKMHFLSTVISFVGNMFTLLLLFHFLRSIVPGNKCNKQKLCMLFFTLIKLVVSVLPCMCVTAHIKWSII